MTEKLRIRHVDPKKLQPAPYNPNEMTAEQYGRLRASIERWGFLEPILVNTETGWIVGGHHRTKAAIELGIDTVPVIERAFTPDEERAVNVVLNNRLAQGDFEPKKLAETLGPIADSTLLEGAGFDFDDYIKVLATAGMTSPEGRDPTPIPKPQHPKSKPGQWLRLGRHVLVVGDATDGDNYPATVDACFTDPPYNVDYEGRTDDKLKIGGDNLTDDTYTRLLTDTFGHIAAATTGAVYVCHATRTAPEVRAAWDAAGLHLSSTIAWVKDRFVMGRSDYHWQWEPILYGWNPKASGRYWIGDRNQGNVWEQNAPKRQPRQGNVWRHSRPAASRAHPTMKPVSLVEKALRNSVPPGGTVLDPFAGSGTTLIAAENLGRGAWVIEYDPGYADVIVERWRAIGGTEPEPVPDPTTLRSEWK